MAIYFKINDPNSRSSLYVTIEEAKEVLESMVQNKYDNDGDEKYIFEAVEMTEKEFKELPEFLGF